MCQGDTYVSWEYECHKGMGVGGTHMCQGNKSVGRICVRGDPCELREYGCQEDMCH